VIAIAVALLALSGVTAGWIFSRKYRARSKLNRMGIEVSDRSLAERIENHDAHATELLLRAGIRPDVPIGGRTPFAIALAAADERTLSAVITRTAPATLAGSLLRESSHLPMPASGDGPPVDTLYSAREVIDHVYASATESLERAGRAEILNLGLDLEFVQTFLLYRVIFDKDFHNLTYQGMLLDGDAEAVRPFINGRSSIHSATASAVIEKINNQVEGRSGSLDHRGVSIEIRTYQTLPAVHGFLVGGCHLYLGFTEFDQGKLQGGQFPYLYLRQTGRNELAAHLFRMFRSWFEYHWSRGSSVCRS
jgi:hypothetical protein